MKDLMEEVQRMMLANRPASEVLPKLREAMVVAQQRAVQCMIRESLAISLFGSLVVLLVHSGLSLWYGVPAYLATAFFVREIVVSVRMYYIAGKLYRTIAGE